MTAVPESLSSPAHLVWLRHHAEMVTADLLCSSECTLLRGCEEDVSEALFRQLKTAAASALDVLYYNGDIGSDDEILCRGEQLIMQACPNLMKIIDQTGRFFAEALSEAMTRVEQYRARINGILPGAGDFQEITGIHFPGSDLHNYGRQVIVFETNAGRFVYKPRSLRPDSVARQISLELFPNVFDIPQVICGDGFGFCEYVQNDPATNVKDAAEYYYRLGGFCAISRMLGTTDLHLENIMCRNNTPVLTDCETVLSPVLYREDMPQSEKALAMTLHSSNLLPYRVNGREASFLFSSDAENLSAPLINGARQTVDKYLDEFLEGFTTTYRKGLEIRDKLCEFAQAQSGYPVRVILRSTAGYSKLLTKTRRWKWLMDPTLDDELRRVLLETPTDGRKATRAQVESEWAAIRRGDIPYFTVDPDSRDIYDANGLVSENFVSLSPQEKMMNCIESLSESDLEYHCGLFRK